MADSAPFVWGEGGSKDSVSRRRRIAEALMLKGTDTSPVQHWTQGLNRVAQALLGGYESNQIDKEEKAGQAAVAGDAALLMGGASPSPAATAPTAATTAPAAPSMAGEGTVSAVAAPAALAPIFTTKEAEYKLPTNYLPQVANIESRFNPSAKNPNSSAAGLFQFTKGTARDYGLANPMDPIASTDAAARLAADNAQTLTRALGRAPTAGELYLAHQQGGGGASKLLANPNARAIDIVGRDAVINNGGHAGMSAGEFAKRWTSKVALNDADQPASDAIPVAMETGQPGFVIPPAPVQSIQGDDPAKLRADAQVYAQSNPEAARQLLARADAAEAAGAAAAPQPVPAPQQAAVAPDMTGRTFDAITSGEKPLDPVFQTEGVAQPWMGTALPAQSPQAQVAQAPLPPPRPADLRADMPAAGAVPAIGQMPQPQPMPDLTSAENAGALQFAVQEGERRNNQPSAQQAPANPFSRVVQALSGQSQPQAAYAQAQAPAPAAAKVAQALDGSPAQARAPSPAVDRVAAAMRVLNSPYAQPGQRAIATAIVQQSMKDPQEVELRRLTVEKARREAENAPLDAEGRRLDIETKKKALGETKAPPTLKIKQADGSEVVLERDAKTGVYAPIQAPLGGAAVGPAPANPYALPGKPTESQSKDAGFAGRMVESHNIINDLESVGTNRTQTALGAVPLIGNALSSADKQRFEQAKRNFVTATLRKESGAAISQSEFDTEEKKYFPQVGDTPQVIEQKRRARELAIEGVMAGAGTGYKVPDTYKPGAKKEAAPESKPPAGVDANVWKHMTPEERALWN